MKNELTIPDDPDSFVIGLFDPESIGQGMKAKGLTVQEIVGILTDQIRNGRPHDQREAITKLHAIAKDAVSLSGQVQTARIERKDENGDIHVLSAQRLTQALQRRPVLNEKEVVVTRPLSEQTPTTSHLPTEKPTTNSHLPTTRSLEEQGDPEELHGVQRRCDREEGGGDDVGGVRDFVPPSDQSGVGQHVHAGESGEKRDQESRDPSADRVEPQEGDEHHGVPPRGGDTPPPDPT